MAGHVYELLIVLVVLVVIGAGAYLLVRMAARTAAREYARTRAEKDRQQH